MKKFLYLSVGLIVMCGLLFTVCSAQEKAESQTQQEEEATRKEEPTQRNFESPTNLFSTIVQRANLY
jgi:hypothetical protein